MDQQRMRFFRALARIAAGQGDLARLVPYLEELGRAHRKFGVRERHYDVFRRALMTTLHKLPAPAWDSAPQRAWEGAFDHAARIIIDAAKRDADDFPAWWTGTVTRTERRGPDIADRDVYISGPDEMIVKTSEAVMGRGAPRHLIRYDLAR